MLRRHCLVIVLPAVFVLITGCHSPNTTTDMQTREMDELWRSPNTRVIHAHMKDNAVLRDMLVADIHFVRHTPELSGVGEVRLNTLAKLLATYGGVVRYETQLENEELIEQRLGHVREYLELTGCDMDRVEVIVGIPGGRGMAGDEAVEKFNKGTASDDTGGSDTMTLLPGT